LAMSERESMRTVLMIAPFYPPCLAWPTAAARTASLSAALPEHGWQPFLIVPRFPGPTCTCHNCRLAVGKAPLDVRAPITPIAEVSVQRNPWFPAYERKRSQRAVGALDLRDAVAWRATVAARVILPEA